MTDGKTFNELMDELLVDGYTVNYINRYLNKRFEAMRPKFQKVPFGQFFNDWIEMFDGEWDADNQHDVSDINYIYDNIKLPERSTSRSAGYDFVSPLNFVLSPGESIMIPTGIRAVMADNTVLMIFPRSGLGTKHQLVLTNSTAIIDADYADADNWGHIMLKMVNKGDERVTIEQGQKFAQGVFLPYLAVQGDDASGVRTGGFGSTDGK